MPRESNVPARRLSDRDIAECHAILAAGSKSFATAARVLPPRVRGPAAIFYAFCRVADDAIDESADPTAALVLVRRRLDRMWSGIPDDHPVDRALCSLVAEHQLPRAPFDALLQGFAWDAQGRTYETFEALVEYAVRVASTVGVVMTLLMDAADRSVLARACDLGVAMQLTNIARDVGEDAKNGRVYLPRTWLRACGLEPADLMTHERWDPRLAPVVERLLGEADRFYARSRAGVAALPSDCRLAIAAAALIYADIGRVIRQRGHDTVSSRATVGRWRKRWLVLRAWWQPRPRRGLDAPIVPQAVALLEAVT